MRQLYTYLLLTGWLLLGSVACGVQEFGAESSFADPSLSGPAPQAQAQSFDVVVVGAGTGGVAAAIQAARMNAEVLLLEETDWVGGQLTSGGVANLDDYKDQWAYTHQGIFGEFADRVRDFYQHRAQYAPKAVNTSICGPVAMEPRVGQLVLREMLSEAGVTLKTRARVVSVLQSGQNVTGVVLADDLVIHSHVVIDATEHGDLIPLTSARYYVGKSRSDAIDQNDCIQDLTYTAVIRKYPNGVPADLWIDEKPPGYDQELARFQNRLKVNGYNTGMIRPWNWPRHNAYRGMPDQTNPDSYIAIPQQQHRITRTGVNDSNDYPGTMLSYVNGERVGTPIGRLTAGYLEDPELRRSIDCKAKLVTINLLYYIQHAMGEAASAWSVVNDEGYDTPYNIDENSCPNIPQRLKAIEALLPQRPYVRESRRIVPIQALNGRDIFRDPQTLHATKRYPSAVALGTYTTDMHNCKGPNDFDLGDTEQEYQERRGIKGPFQIPLEALIPEAVDGLLAAEKNIGVSRIVNGAIRLHGVTMLTGQAAGATAALAVEGGVQPRDLRAIDVQEALLDAGSSLALYHFDDVPLTHGFWKSVQLVNLYGIMNGYSNTNFGVEGPITREQMAVVLARLFELDLTGLPNTSSFTDVDVNHWARPSIEAILDAGITTGCGQNPPRFCPGDQVTRGQLATFVVRGLGWDPATAPTEPVFEDIDLSHPFFRSIQLIGEAGIMLGCSQNPRRFCDTVATRGQVAAVAARVLLRIR